MRALEALDADVIGGKRMMMKSTGLTLDARQLLEGFINSFNNLLLPADKYVDRAQETYAILDYFRKLGSALGYWPWCEVSKRDLEWYGPKDDEDEEYKKVILHLESENCSKRRGITIDK